MSIEKTFTAPSIVRHPMRDRKLLSHLRTFLPQSALEHVIQDTAVARPSTFRTTCLKGHVSMVLRSIAEDLGHSSKDACRFQRCSWYTSAFSLTGVPALSKGQITRLRAAKQGMVLFQGLASMLPALCLDARPGMKVWPSRSSITHDDYSLGTPVAAGAGLVCGARRQGDPSRSRPCRDEPPWPSASCRQQPRSDEASFEDSPHALAPEAGVVSSRRGVHC